MENPISRATLINLEHFPAYHVPVGECSQVENITGYLIKLVNEPLVTHGGYLELPSISNLSVFFRCSFLEVYDAFKALRKQGYDYQFSSLDGAMLVWISGPAKPEKRL